MLKLPSQLLNDELAKHPYSTIVSRNKKWFDDYYDDRTEFPIQPNHADLLRVGTMYTFTYDAKYKDKLIFWDSMPMSICIGHIKTQAGNYNAMGINLSFLPPKTRRAVLDRITKVFRTSIMKPNLERLDNDKDADMLELPLYYDICKKILKNSGFEFAIRSYIYSRMMTEPRIISYPDWWRVTTFPSQYILKKNIRAIYYLQKRSRDDSYRIGQRDRKVKLDQVRIRDINTYLKNRNS